MKSPVCIIFFFILGFTLNLQSYCQNVAIGESPFNPDNSALLELRTQLRGFLPPRLSTVQRDAINSPADGLIIFNIDTGCIEYYFVNQWYSMCGIATLPCLGFTAMITSSVNPNCVMGNDGTSTVGVNAGNPPFTYHWSNGQTTQTANGLNAGQYGVTVTDFQSCTASTIVTISDGSNTAPLSPTQGIHSVTPLTITWNWNTSLNATAYLYNTTNDLNSAISNLGETSFIQTGLSSCQNYDLYVWAQNECGISGASLFHSTTANALPTVPQAQAAVTTPESITWLWSSSSDAVSYAVNSVNDYSTSNNIGNLTQYQQNTLTCNTQYSLYVWALNACGHSVPLLLTATTEECLPNCTPVPCPDAPTVMDIQGNIYPTVQIGTQCWFGKNLRVKKYVNNSDITYAETNAEWSAAGTEGRWCYPLNNPSLESEYGLFYNGRVAKLSDICPTGWRIPVLNDWQILVDNIGINQAKSLKDAPPIWNGTNACGFNGRKGGYRAGSGIFYDNQDGFWWTQTTGTSGGSWIADFRLYDYDSYQLNPWGSEIQSGRYIRCIKQ